MPTPRQHGGAALALIPMTVPGFRGLNTQQASGILTPEWSTRLDNAVIDDNSRVAARKGWASETSVPLADPIVQLHVYAQHDGSEDFVASTATGLWLSDDGGDTWDSVVGSIVVTAGNWQFANFNDFVYGIQQGEDLIKSNGGNFASVVQTNVPDGNCLISAFGRLWASGADGVSLHFSGLLNGDDWDTADAGIFDMTNVWPGTDTITAIASFNNFIVVFGRDNIVFFADDTGSEIGLDPANATVKDIITGLGCIARDSVQSVDGDLWFLSYTGIQSIGRLLVQRSNPYQNLSVNVQDELLRATVTSGYDLDDLRSVYSPRDRFYLLSLPGDETGVSFVFDTRGRLEDGSARCMGKWTLYPLALAVTRDKVLYVAPPAAEGEIGIYTGSDDDGEEYIFRYESGWLDLTQQGYLLIPKRFSGIFFTSAAISVNYLWAFDFDSSMRSVAKTFDGAGAGGEFGESEFGEDEFGSGVALRNGHVNPTSTGEIVKVGISTTINETTFAVQQLDLYCKIGRLS